MISFNIATQIILGPNHRLCFPLSWVKLKRCNGLRQHVSHWLSVTSAEDWNRQLTGVFYPPVFTSPSCPTVVDIRRRPSNTSRCCFKPAAEFQRDSQLICSLVRLHMWRDNWVVFTDVHACTGVYTQNFRTSSQGCLIPANGSAWWRSCSYDTEGVLPKTGWWPTGASHIICYLRCISTPLCTKNGLPSIIIRIMHLLKWWTVTLKLLTVH